MNEMTYLIYIMTWINLNPPELGYTAAPVPHLHSLATSLNLDPRFQDMTKVRHFETWG